MKAVTSSTTETLFSVFTLYSVQYETWQHAFKEKFVVTYPYCVPLEHMFKTTWFYVVGCSLFLVTTAVISEVNRTEYAWNILMLAYLCYPKWVNCNTATTSVNVTIIMVFTPGASLLYYRQRWNVLKHELEISHTRPILSIWTIFNF
jgi:hypothetical protein